MGFGRRLTDWLGITEPAALRDGTVAASGRSLVPARGDVAGVTVEQALTVGAVNRSVQIIQVSMRNLELAVFRGGRRIDPPLLIRQPDPDLPSAGAFIAETVWELATRGEAFWRLYGSPVSVLKVLPAAEVSVEWADRAQTRRRYRWRNAEIPASQIRHLVLLRRPGELRGKGPIQWGAREIWGAFKLREFTDGWFDLNTPIDGFLSSDQHLNEQMARELAERWRAFLKREGIAVLGAGLKYEQLHGKPAELQMIEVHRAQTIGIARWFGVQPTDLLLELSGTSHTYQNIEQGNLSFLQKTLADYVSEIEDAFTSLLPRGQHAEFLEDGLLRLDTISRWRTNKLKVDLGYTSGAELRRLDGLDPLPPSERQPPPTPRSADPAAEPQETA